MSQAGWYPDPGGRPGMFRFWDGQAWSNDVSPTPGAPTSARPGSIDPTQPLGSGSARPSIPQGSAAYHARPAAPTQRRTPVGAIVAAVIGVLALILIAGVGLRSISSGGGGGGLFPQPVSSPTDEACPKNNVTVTPRQHPADGRLHGGMISMPRLGAPWSAPLSEDRVPFGADVHAQNVTVESNYDGRGQSWVASIVLGDLVAGDGFYSPHEGADIVAHCVVGLFYGNNKIERQDLKSEQHDLDGKDGWLIQMHLSFDIRGLQCKGETATILVVATGSSSASLYYSSIPDTTPELMATQDQALAQLTVGP